MVTMSGVDERPSLMPTCQCGKLKTWIVRGALLGRTATLVWVNVDDIRRQRWGRWHFVHSKDRIMVGRAVDMYCGECNVMASFEDLARVVALFERERLGDKNERS
jgi:hypothetical protein